MTGTINERHLASLILQEQLRSRRLIKKLTYAIAALLLAALLLSVSLAISKELPVFYTVSEETVTVTAGSTLWGIADEYMGEYPGSIRAYIAEVCRLNGIENASLIEVGAELSIPIYRYKLR